MCTTEYVPYILYTIQFQKMSHIWVVHTKKGCWKKPNELTGTQSGKSIRRKYSFTLKSSLKSALVPEKFHLYFGAKKRVVYIFCFVCVSIGSDWKFKEHRVSRVDSFEYPISRSRLVQNGVQFPVTMSSSFELLALKVFHLKFLKRDD